VARREARALFDICAGFVYSQTLFACVKLGLFDALANGPLDEASLAQKLGLAPDAARRLLTATTALRLTKHAGRGRWDLGRLGSAVTASPGLAAMVEHHAVLYRDLADPVRLLKGQADTALSSYWPYAKPDTEGTNEPDDVFSYTKLMAATQRAIAVEVLDSVRFNRFRCVMDAGGGNGAFLAQAAKREPSLGFMLFELPGVAALARQHILEAGLGHRIQVFEGDMKRDPLPAGADAITLIRILLDHDNANALDILKAVRKALPPGGTLVIAEPMAETAGAESVGAYFALYLLAMGGGRPRTKQELTTLLQTAGFSKITEKRTCQPLLTRILLAQ